MISKTFWYKRFFFLCRGFHNIPCVQPLVYINHFTVLIIALLSFLEHRQNKRYYFLHKNSQKMKIARYLLRSYLMLQEENRTFQGVELRQWVTVTRKVIHMACIEYYMILCTRIQGLFSPHITWQYFKSQLYGI